MNQHNEVPHSKASTTTTEPEEKRNPVVIHSHIIVIPGSIVRYRCNICTKTFKTKAHVKYHEFCVKDEKPFTCRTCGKWFIAKYHFEFHEKTHTGKNKNTGKKQFGCKVCGRGFRTDQALRSHNLIHTGERPYNCDKTFTGQLKKHQIAHTGEQRPHECRHCKKSFGLQWVLDLHMRTHSNCEHKNCSEAFSSNKDLQRNFVIHSGVKPFKCWICQTAFRRKDNLNRHIKNIHNDDCTSGSKDLSTEAGQIRSKRI